MYDNFDTGLIVSISYIRNIKYDAFSPLEIDANSEISNKRFQKSKNRVICSTVEYELNQIMKARKIMHKIISLELIKADEELIQEEYLNLAVLRLVTRDLAWIADMRHKLKKYDIEEVHHQLEEIRIMFELNIREILRHIEVFKPNDSLKVIRTKIKKIIDTDKNKPNPNDIIILANAILYHNHKNETCFVSTDRGFDRLDHSKIFESLKEKKIEQKYPKIEYISS